MTSLTEERTASSTRLVSTCSSQLSSNNTECVPLCLTQNMEINSHDPASILSAGVALHDAGRFDEAINCYDKAIAIAPAMGETYNNRGNSLVAVRRYEEAVESYTMASTLLSSSPVPLSALANVLQTLGKVEESEACCRNALKRDPQFPEAHWNLALNLLLQGRYLEGWQEYEWRWQRLSFTSPARHTNNPLWDGSSLIDKTIVIHAEQGFGDAIQFIRYIPCVIERGAHQIIIECHPPLVQLFKTIQGVSSVVSFDEQLPVFDCHIPLLSLPHIFKTTLQTIPFQSSYLKIAIDYQMKWRKLISPDSTSLRVGLVWSGKPYPDPLRSCRLVDLGPLADLGNVIFYTLQLGPGSEQASTPPPGMKLINLTNQIYDFADTAALINMLDIVICIDTAVAHLAGALGKPVYVMLPFAPDWRWLLERNDSPWYSTMRLFRQKQPGDWREVALQIQSALETLIRYKKKFL